MEVAVILYYASGLSAATAIVGLLGFCLGIRGARGRLRALSIVCAMAFAVIIVLPWILHGNATRIVGHVVE